MNPSIPMPPNIAALPKDRRGYPIPFIVQIDPAGVPLFTVNDNGRQLECVFKKICPICGVRLSKQLWYVGGPKSAFHKYGCYHDSAMHYECMAYALRVCPYLAMRGKRADMEKILPHMQKRMGSGAILVDPTMEPGTPVVFVAVMATGRTLIGEPPMVDSRPLRPYLAVEFWKDGAQLLFNDGVALAQTLPGLEIEPALRICRRIYA